MNPDRLLEPKDDARPPFRATLAQRFGDWRRERRVGRDLREKTLPPPPHAFGRFGNSFIVPPARIAGAEYIFLGDGVHVLEYAWFAVFRVFDDIVPRLAIGDRTRIGRGVQLSCVGEITIEEDVGISDHVLLGDTFHVYDDVTLNWEQQAMARPQRVFVGAGAGIGYDAIILPGVSIGRGACVLEGSVVTRDVAPRTVVAGNPARVVHPDAKGSPVRREG